MTKQPPEETPAASGNAIRTMIVDDTVPLTNLIKVVLERRSPCHVVGVAHNGHDAVELYEKLKPDLVIMDVNMPRMNGLAATKAIKSMPNPPKIIVVSFENFSTFNRAALQAGADRYCNKEFLLRDLVAMIRELFPEADPV